MSTVKPIDEDLIIACAKETKAIITAEEHSIIGGLGSAVCEVLSENRPVPVKRIGINDTFCSSGPAPELFAHYGLTGEHIAQAAQSLLSRI